ncbi:MAG: hypothetical protein J0M33_00085 [Anaerolineae bacterium]|nr:hypothetical protein [Anaerolineae bacterium]
MRRMMIALVGAALLLGLATVRAQGGPPTVAGCTVFPADNLWNTRVDSALVHPNSAAYIANINANGGQSVHPDFGEDPSYGIPWATVPGSQPLVPVDFYYPDESDPGPYPIPPDAPVEGGGDRHVLIIDQDNCILYEMFDSTFNGPPSNSWSAGSGAVFDLGSNALRPEGWTSADAAGLPIFPGLARCEEANSGVINHALRFTVRRTQRAYIYPARHFASSLTDANYPPMGLRFRLKADYPIDALPLQAKTIATALKQYGMILADNGSNWFISGETNPGCWDDDQLNTLKAIPGTAFEVVVNSGLEPSSTSAAPTRTVFNLATPTLTWLPVSGAQGYNLQISSSATFASGMTQTYLIPSGESWTATPALVRGIYYWRTCARDAGGVCGGWSSTETFAVIVPTVS